MFNETFHKHEIEKVIKDFLVFGEDQFGKGHHGYFSGHGFAARCLRYHLEQLKIKNRDTNVEEIVCEDVSLWKPKIFRTRENLPGTCDDERG
jgi:hypothetical protein